MQGTRRLCTRCGQTPLRSHNVSGLCTACRTGSRRVRQAPALPRIVGDADRDSPSSAVPIAALPALDSAPDEYLMAAVRELAARIDRVRREAQERVDRLQEALSALGQATGSAP